MEFIEIAKLHQTRQFDEALLQLDNLHREWHDRPIAHIVIHFWQARIAFTEGRFRNGAWELFALLFAAPVSLVQRYSGIVRKDVAKGARKNI